MRAVGVLVGVICALYAASAAWAGGPPTNVTFSTDDGILIAATSYPGNDGAPGVILIPMLGRTRADWKDLAPAIQTKGFWVVAIDLRGHGGSTKSPKGALDYKKFNEQDFRRTDHDVAAAAAWLADQGAAPQKVAIVGASIGANAALVRCASDSRVKAVVLLSPGENYRGIDTTEPAKKCAAPTWYVAAEGDAESAKSVPVLSAFAPKTATSKIYPGTAHGTNLFAEHKDLQAAIVEFLAAKLK